MPEGQQRPTSDSSVPPVPGTTEPPKHEEETAPTDGDSDQGDPSPPSRKKSTGIFFWKSEVEHEKHRESQRKLHIRESRRYQFWRAGLVGVVAGLFGVLFQKSLLGAEHLRESIVELVRSNSFLGCILTMVFCAALAGAAVLLTTKFAPEAAGSGIPHVKGVLMGMRHLRWVRVIIVKFVGGFLALGAGLSLGREGPTIQIGAATGMGVAEKLKARGSASRTLVSAGAGAGLAAAFNAPLAGFLFVIEELQRELTPITYGAALIACVTADAITRLLIGQHSAFHIYGYPSPPMAALPLVAVLGVLAGLLGVAFNKCLLGTTNTMRAIRAPDWAKGVTVGAIAGLAVWFIPAVTGGGHRTAEIVLSGQFAKASALWIVVGLLAAKFALTMISYGSGAPGGIFAPMLVMGAFLGLGFGEATRGLLATVNVSPAAFAVIGMAALFSSTVRSPLTGIVLIVEMTGNYEQLYALIVACLLAYLIAEWFRDEPVYDALLENDLHKPDPAGGVGSDPALVEVYVEPTSFMDGRQVDDLALPTECALVSVLRGQNEIVPAAGFHIKAGDIAVLISEREHAHLLYTVAKLARASE